MKLSPDEFDLRFNAERLCLAFIGMSNIGKSYTAQRLRKSHGFGLYEVDEAIQHKLGLASMQESADWMGFPYASNYPAREAEYLACESELTAEAFNSKYAAKNMIIDTTGSVIYADKPCLDILRDKAIIVHIQAAPENLAHLEELYFRAPKPLIWAGKYEPKPAEDSKQSLKRCYPALLRSRMDAYNDLADINLPASMLFSDETTPESLMDFIRNGRQKS